MTIKTTVLPGGKVRMDDTEHSGGGYVFAVYDSKEKRLAAAAAKRSLALRMLAAAEYLEDI